MESTVARLQYLSTLLEQKIPLEESLKQCVFTISEILNVRNVVIMLLGDNEDDAPIYKTIAITGDSSLTANISPIRADDKTLGKIFSSETPHLITHLDETELARLNHSTPDISRSLMAAPIRINEKVVGIISASGHHSNRPLETNDLELIGIIGLLIGKSMQVAQLQKVLSSRFAQLALVREAKTNLGEALEKAVENPDQLARILAKSFFREMTQAGFNSSQIINASSEIITQLSSSLNRHSKRLAKSTGQ